MKKHPQQRLKCLSIVWLLIGILVLAACEDTTGSGPEEAAGASDGITTVVSTPVAEAADTTAETGPTVEQAAATTDGDVESSTDSSPTTDPAATTEPAADSSMPEPATNEEGTSELAYSENSGGGGGTNQVRVVNQPDHRSVENRLQPDTAA